MRGGATHDVARSVTVVGRPGARRPRPRPSSQPLEDTITTRALATIPGIFLALTLTACGASGGAGSEASSGSASPSPAAATGADYAALFTALRGQQGKVKAPTTAAQFNQQASFPPGISVGTFDQKAQSLCIQDENKDISGTFTGTGNAGIVLSDGICGKGKQVSKLVPDPKNQGKILVEGDKKIGQPVADVFAQQPSGGSGS